MAEKRVNLYITYQDDVVKQFYNVTDVRHHPDGDLTFLNAQEMPIRIKDGTWKKFDEVER